MGRIMAAAQWQGRNATLPVRGAVIGCNFDLPQYWGDYPRYSPAVILGYCNFNRNSNFRSNQC
jgi:hypothetical protein